MISRIQPVKYLQFLYSFYNNHLTQVVKELKRTKYGKNVNISVMGSRQQLCVHPKVSKQSSNQLMVHMCRTKVKKRLCHYYNNVEKGHRTGVFTSKIMDIEDMAKMGEATSCCPYYAVREIAKNSGTAVIFTPYNYLLDKKSRKAQGLETAGNIVIIDEAHNLEKNCEESSSFELTSTDLAHCIQEMNEILEAVNKFKDSGITSEDADETSSSLLAKFNRDELALMKQLFLVLEQYFLEIELDKTTNSLQKSGSYIFELFNRVNLNFDTYEVLLALLENIYKYLSTLSNQFKTRGVALQKFTDIIRIVFAPMNAIDPDSRSRVDELSTFYRVFIEEKEKTFNKNPSNVWNTESSNQDTKVRTLSYWCFSPGYAMKDLVATGVRNLILTSGTLTPLNTFITEFHIPAPITISNGHVIEPHQVFVGVVRSGVQGGNMKLTYGTRDDRKMAVEIGTSLCSIARSTPGGMLVFFASYSAMINFRDKWEDMGVMEELQKIKPVTVEDKKDFKATIDSYYSSIKTKKEAILFAVCRGKVSEGLDFSNENGRAVVILGIPFPPAFDPKVKLKQLFLNDLRKKEHFKDFLSGEEWYRLQACRAVNQAIGRVIRHRHDYGAIILFDTRYSMQNQIKELPVWIRDQVVVFDDFAKYIRRLKSFFCSVQAKESIRLKGAPPPSKINYTQISATSQKRKLTMSSNFVKVSDFPKFNEKVVHIKSQSTQKSNLTISEAMSQYDCCKNSHFGGSLIGTDLNSLSLLSALNSNEAGSGFTTFNFHNQTPSDSSQGSIKRETLVVEQTQADPLSTPRVKKRIKLKDSNRIKKSFVSEATKQSDVPCTSKAKEDEFTNQNITTFVSDSSDASSCKFDEAALIKAPASEFLKALKSNLDASKFAQIKKFTHLCKKTDDVDQFASSMVSTLKNHNGCEIVLRLYLRFLKKELHKKYKMKCNSLLGKDVFIGL